MKEIKITPVAKPSNLEFQFQLFLRVDNIKGFEREYKFHPIRRWKFDFADPKNKIAVELEGGIWTNGRHTRGKGFKADTEKYNEAVKLGWKVLRYCGIDQMRNFKNDYKQIVGL